LLVAVQADETETAEKLPQNVLRVGISPDYPPMIFKQGKKLAGLEFELANILARELDRLVKFLELRWDQQIPALMAGKTDIIMSGMSVTKARQVVRIDFTDYYLKSGLLAAMRIQDSPRYRNVKDIMDTSLPVGVVRNTTSEVFVKKNLTNASRIVVLSQADSGPLELKRRTIDLFVHDAPSIIWLVSKHEADITGFWKPLNTEHLAWGVARGNDALLHEVNSILRKWKQDGTLNRVISRWLPYLNTGTRHSLVKGISARPSARPTRLPSPCACLPRGWHYPRLFASKAEQMLIGIN